MSLSLLKLSLSNFRGYEAARLSFHAAKIHVLTGENGSGKTNVLEAISLFAPGRGLRGADLGALQRRQSDAPDRWALAADIMGKTG